MSKVKVMPSDEHAAEQPDGARTQEESASAEAQAADQDAREFEALCSECARKDTELAELRDKILRLAAETENTRKRLERERREAVTYANESLIRAMLPVLDNLQRALEHGGDGSDFKTLLEGVRLTAKSFAETLEKFGCKPFDCLGQPFDPNFHEAMLHQESAEYPENTVLQEYQKGYLLHDRLLRPAMVVVAKAVAPSPPKPMELDHMDL